MPTSKKNNNKKNCSRSCDDDDDHRHHNITHRNKNSAIDDDNNERGSVSSSSYGNPLQYFVFIVGHCDEWPENRETQGDIGLYKAYEKVGIPHDQMILLTQSKELTKESCQTTLLTFLQSQTMKTMNEQFQNRTTFIFYYGGHGTSTGFTTLQEEWKYKDVIDLIDGNFDGQRVVFMADCCGSGNLCNLLYEKVKRVDTNNNKKQYVCLANTAAYLPASTGGDDEEWIMNYCWIECLKRNCRHKNVPLYQILNILVDRNAIKLGDQLTIYLSANVDVNSYDWLPTTTATTTVTTTTKVTKTTKVTTTTTTTQTTTRTGRTKRQKKDNYNKTTNNNNFFATLIEYCYCYCCFDFDFDFDFGFNEEDDVDDYEEEEVESYDEWKKQFENYSIPTKGIVSSKWTVGDTVFYKYTGGYPTSVVDNNNNGDSSSSSSSSSTSPVYVPPGWMRATILSEEEMEEKKNGHDDSKNDDNEKQSGGDTVQLLVTYPVKQISWIVNTVCRNSLINDIHMGQMYMECKKLNKVQCFLAKKYYMYIDYSIPPNTKIKVRKKSSNDTNDDTIIVKRKLQKNGEDDDDDNGRRSDDIDGTTTRHISHEQQLPQTEVDVETEEAIVLDWKDFDWKSYYNNIVANADVNDDANGDCKKQYQSIQPCIPIRWLSNDKTELLPLELVIPSTTVIGNTLLSALQRTGRGLGKNKEETQQEQQDQEQLQRNALIASIESSGKTICNAKTKLLGSDKAMNSGDNDFTTPTTKKQLIAYWPEDRGWYDAVPLDPETISLEILASHSQFIPRGLYCPLLYEDGVSALTPLHYVRVRSERKKKRNIK